MLQVRFINRDCCHTCGTSFIFTYRTCVNKLHITLAFHVTPVALKLNVTVHSYSLQRWKMIYIFIFVIVEATLYIIFLLQPKATFFPLVSLKMQPLVSRDDNYRKCLITSSCRVRYVFASHRLTFIESKGKVVTHSVRVGGLTYRLAIFFFYERTRLSTSYTCIEKYFSQTCISNSLFFFVKRV